MARVMARRLSANGASKLSEMPVLFRSYTRAKGVRLTHVEPNLLASCSVRSKAALQNVAAIWVQRALDRTYRDTANRAAPAFAPSVGAARQQRALDDELRSNCRP